MKVALVHDWLTGMRGGEFVLDALCEMFPDADLYTLVHVKGSVSPLIENRRIFTSFLNRFPGVDKRYRWFLPLMPKAIESFKLEGYDLVISTSHCVAKGIKPGGAQHVCYCHTPMRYAWDLYDQYFNRQRTSPLALFAIERIMPYLRNWDKKTASRVDRFIANSGYVKERIKRIYGMDSDVIYPPVDVDYYTPLEPAAKDSYLIVSAFAPYKRVDIAIELFNKLEEPLTIVGKGQDDTMLRSMAKPNITFEGSVSREKLRKLYQNAKALIYPGEEDFGIIPVEAMACGTPVIAFGKGGVLETVKPLRDRGTANPTGMFFDKQTAADLGAVVERFEDNVDLFEPEKIRDNALRFRKHVFMKKIKEFLDSSI